MSFLWLKEIKKKTLDSYEERGRGLRGKGSNQIFKRKIK